MVYNEAQDLRTRDNAQHHQRNGCSTLAALRAVGLHVRQRIRNGGAACALQWQLHHES